MDELFAPLDPDDKVPPPETPPSPIKPQEPIILFFDVGDIAYCPLNQFRGEIISIVNEDDSTYVTLANGMNQMCRTQLRQHQEGHFLPSYLQMVCKKSEVQGVTLDALGIGWTRP